jgi:phosphate transport system protein
MPVETRIHFHEELAKLEEQALGGLDLVVAALDRTVEALEQQDVELAAMVIADDDKIDGRYLEVHQGVLSLMARQAPVATDLRLIAALLDTIKHFERMGDQCVNIAKLLQLTAPDMPPAAEPILSRIVEMGRQARAQILQAKRAFAERNVELAEDLVVQDDKIDDLNRESFKAALEIGDDVDARETAMHLMLAARACERMGDLAVDIGEQVAFVVTGLFYEFTDASHPELAPPSVRG